MPANEAVNLRSDFLVHWTGKDIQPNYKAMTRNQRTQYVDRLYDTIHYGLWMTENTEKLYGYDDRFIQYKDIYITCFTETKLSSALKHTRCYGCLGFGFNRMFVIRNLGGPVHYLPGTRDDFFVGNLAFVNSMLSGFRHPVLYGGISPFQGRIDTGFVEDDYINAVTALQMNFAFMKNMSQNTCPHDFQYLDEAEWRIVRSIKYLDRMGRKTVYSEEDAKTSVEKTGIDRPKFRIRFGIADIKVLVLPDGETRKQAMAVSEIRNWLLQDPTVLPIIASIEECRQF